MSDPNRVSLASLGYDACVAYHDDPAMCAIVDEVLARKLDPVRRQLLIAGFLLNHPEKRMTLSPAEHARSTARELRVEPALADDLLGEAMDAVGEAVRADHNRRVHLSWRTTAEVFEREISLLLDQRDELERQLLAANCDLGAAQAQIEQLVHTNQLLALELHRKGTSSDPKKTRLITQLGVAVLTSIATTLATLGVTDVYTQVRQAESAGEQVVDECQAADPLPSQTLSPPTIHTGETPWAQTFGSGTYGGRPFGSK